MWDNIESDLKEMILEVVDYIVIHVSNGSISEEASETCSSFNCSELMRTC
jgi:hypothetical protein